jgi:hypothetical protein
MHHGEDPEFAGLDRPPDPSDDLGVIRLVRQPHVGCHPVADQILVLRVNRSEGRLRRDRQVRQMPLLTSSALGVDQVDEATQRHRTAPTDAA